MKAWIPALILVASILGASMTMAQPVRLNVVAEFPGSYLKWIHIAESEFKQARLNLDDYKIVVLDEDESIIVFIVSLVLPGDPGAVKPAYEVEINKKDSKILHSNYAR